MNPPFYPFFKVPKSPFEIHAQHFQAPSTFLLSNPIKIEGAARTASCGVTNENTYRLDGTRTRLTTGQSSIHTADLGVTTPPPFGKVSHQLCSNYIIVLETAVSRLGLHFTTKTNLSGYKYQTPTQRPGKVEYFHSNLG